MHLMMTHTLDHMSDLPEPGVPTVLPDLAGLTLTELRTMPLDQVIETLEEVVSRTRANIGGGGPPGRVD